MQTFIKWLFGILLFHTIGAIGQEVDPKVKVLLPPADPQANAKNANNLPANAKIEASKGSPTLPPGLNTTQMVAEQYRNSGALKPYTPVNVGQTSSGTSKAMVNTAGKVLAKPPGSPGSAAGSTSSGSPSTKGPEILPENSKKLKSTNQYESTTSPLGGTNTSSISNPVSGANRAPNGSNPAGNTYDKVPYLNPYEKAPSSPANQYGSLQLKPQSQNSNGTYTAPPANGGNNASNPTRSSTYGPAPNMNTQASGNTYSAPPVTGGNNASKPPTGTGTYGPAPNMNTQASGNIYTAPPANGGNNASNPTRSSTYGPAPNMNTQASGNTYSAPPVTGGNNASKPPTGTGTYGPAPDMNTQASGNTYSAPPVTGGNNAAKPPTGTGTYGPAPPMNTQASGNTFSAPPVTGGNNAAKPPTGTGTYGPAPPMNTQASGNINSAPPVTGIQSSNTYGPPSKTGPGSAGVPPSTSPAGGNPKVSGNPQNGGAIKKIPKSGPPVKR